MKPERILGFDSIVRNEYLILCNTLYVFQASCKENAALHRNTDNTGSHTAVLLNIIARIKQVFKNM